MATKADFSETEWQAMQRGITGAGMLVSVADQDFTDSFGESSAIVRRSTTGMGRPRLLPGAGACEEASGAA